MALVALLGNPNTGKSSVFNRLTGLSQHIANYPGVTVVKKEGRAAAGGKKIRVIDLPGAYSLSSFSPDERVVIDVLLGADGNERPDLVVCVLDATNLKRNLFLASQAAEFGIPMILVLNQWDVLGRSGTSIDVDLLAKNFGVPVVTTVAPTGEGIPALGEAIGRALDEKPRMRRIEWPAPFPAISAEIRSSAAARGRTLSDPEIQRIVFDAHGAVAARTGVDPEAARAALRAAGLNPGSAEALWHYDHIDRLTEGVVARGTERTRRATESIDRLLLHKFWGSIVFVAIMWVVFQSLYSWAVPLMDAIGAATAALQGWIGPRLAGTPILESLVVDGILAGVGGVIVFVPQIAFLFLFIGVLEDSGYMARAAFLMDKCFGWCGLNGKSFIPLLSSYACAVPGIMAARSLEEPKARITTIMMAPLMSCSARLPVYVLLIGAFIEPRFGPWVAGWLLFAMHFLGLLISLPLAWFTNRVLLRTPTLPFLLEMPPYKVPNGYNLYVRTWGGAREFLTRAGTVILAISVIIWALLFFPYDPSHGPRVGEAQIERSYMGRIGKAVQPAFDPAGFDWKITVGVLASFPAREVIIATLGITYNLGAEVDENSQSLREVMSAQRWQTGPRAGTPIFTVPTVLAIMVFFALCLQCGATVTIMAKELDWRWAAAAFFGMTTMAWLGAVFTYQVGTRLG